MAVTKKFVPRQRKHKNVARAKNDGEAPVDSNRAEILLEEQREHNEKKAQLREELRASQPQMSAKKAKRLDKYIELKLKKDENLRLYEKLAASSIDTSMFESTKNLGVGRKRRKAEQRKKESMARHTGSDSGSPDEESSSEAEEAPALKARPNKPAPKPQVATENEPEGSLPAVTTANAIATAVSLFPQAAKSVPAVAGSGLKRPLELGDDGRPVLQKRQKRGGVKSKYQVEQVHTQAKPIVPRVEEDDMKEDEEEEEWDGFSGGDESKEEGFEGKDVIAQETAKEDDTSESESESEESDSSEDKGPSIFKIWATEKRNAALGFQPTTESTTAAMLEIPRPENFEPRPMEQEPLPVELQLSEATGRKVFNVAVTRTAEVEAAREKLPVVAEEHQIMEAIHLHNVVVITGGTGSGKTTQVPQFLFEAGYGSPDSPTPGMIGVTQPRRVAAVSMSKRVAEELGSHGSAVAYQIRFEGTHNKKTAIKFMTDGVLLREMANDVVLSGYSAIIVDEAHERSINTDLLIGLLSRVNQMREILNKQRSEVAGWKALGPLKLIIMSATLQIEDLTKNTQLFSTPPRVISIEGRQFPVTVHFSRTTQTDYVEEAFRKVVRGHRKLPPGSFLVFLTGEDEIQKLAKRLRREINGLDVATGPKVRLSTREAPFEAEDIDFGSGRLDLDIAAIEGEDEEGEGEGEGEEEFVVEASEGEAGTGPLRMNVLPLFSKLATQEQQKVFRPAPNGYRQVILATNVAETSLTIPGVRFVFDCGRAKERRYNAVTGVQSFEVGWINKASADQRSGRAGRTGPGHCYRLYSSALYEASFKPFAVPEMLRMPIEDVVLLLKSFNVPKVDVFPFPTPPDRQNLARAEQMLQHIGAVQRSGKISKLGEALMLFPLPPRYANILLRGNDEGLLHYNIAMVAALTVDGLFVKRVQAPKQDSVSGVRTQEDIRKEEQQRQRAEQYSKVHRRLSSTDDYSDAIKRLHVVAEFSETPTPTWCDNNFVSYKTLLEVQKIRRQLTELLRANMPGLANMEYTPLLKKPTEREVALLKLMAAAGFVDRVAMRADAMPTPPAEFVGRQHPRRAIEVAYVPLLPLDHKQTGSGLVFIHPASVLAHCTVAECPKYVVFSQLLLSSGSAEATATALAAMAAGQTVRSDGSTAITLPKVRMQALTDISAKQLASLARGTSLLTYGKPIKETYVSADGLERQCWVVQYLRVDSSSGLGWELGPTLVKQRRQRGKSWEVVLD
ncbi:deah-box RNA helicase [Grosmannia clavigera kw1407]|uniref:RNA helicase n=1 Tax=Grosmannia clavigera (strain kw1407 / UAMH 11150) TaxID=655863 RepID=F0XCZ6_GROCL|nr:deah-box RNA helicase [Grosmannia clavigera kw1407]EFX03627.1 deah-box RNA helicase [Grosmannia clavigera kw1407]